MADFCHGCAGHVGLHQTLCALARVLCATPVAVKRPVKRRTRKGCVPVHVGLRSCDRYGALQWLSQKRPYHRLNDDGRVKVAGAVPG